MAEKTTKWRLAWGIHGGTMLSRDSGEDITDLESEAACLQQAQELKAEFARLGYSLWFARAYGPNGEQVSFGSLTRPYS